MIPPSSHRDVFEVGGEDSRCFQPHLAILVNTGKQHQALKDVNLRYSDSRCAQYRVPNLYTKTNKSLTILRIFYPPM